MAEVREESTIDAVRRVLARHSAGQNVATISETTPIFGPGGIIQDSLGILDALSEIERELNIAIPDEDLTESLFASIIALSSYVDAKKRG